MYLNQFNEAKERLNTVQRQLMTEQKLAIEAKAQKSMMEQEVAVLKNKMEEETRRAFTEKQDLLRKLEELSVELKDREVRFYSTASQQICKLFRFEKVRGFSDVS